MGKKCHFARWAKTYYPSPIIRLQNVQIVHVDYGGASTDAASLSLLKCLEFSLPLDLGLSWQPRLCIDGSPNYATRRMHPRAPRNPQYPSSRGSRLLYNPAIDRTYSRPLPTLTCASEQTQNLQPSNRDSSHHTSRNTRHLVDRESGSPANRDRHYKLMTKPRQQYKPGEAP